MRARFAYCLFSVAVAACNPYEKRSGEYYAGPVDPASFPAAYKAASYTPAMATAHGEPVAYFAFPAAAGVVDDPLTAPIAYVFDPGSAAPRCAATAPYDARLDAYRPDEQGNVFTALPTASYAPVVAEVPVTSNGEPCQSIKSEKTLVQSASVVVQTTLPKANVPNATAKGVPDGKFLAWAIVDAGADVAGARLGWFNHYLVQYVDGGYLPTTATAEVHAIAQNIYFPTQTPKGAGKLGGGFDLLDATRVDAAYSPLCHVFSFTPADPMNLPTSASDIDASTLVDTQSFIWCLQAEVQP